MGHAKSELLWRGLPFREHIRRAFPMLRTVGDNERFRADVPDLWRRGNSLNGIISAISASSTPFCVVLSCDMPLLGHTQVHALLRMHRPFFYRDAAGILPFPGVYPTSALPFFKTAAGRGHLRLRPLIESLGPRTRTIALRDQSAFENINEPAGYKHLRHL